MNLYCEWKIIQPSDLYQFTDYGQALVELFRQWFRL